MRILIFITYLFLSNVVISQLSLFSQLGADIDGEAADDQSGSSVSMNAAGNRLAIGAQGNDGNGTGAGHVKIYDWNGTAWIQLGADIDGEAAGDLSGCSVSMNAAGDRVAIGAQYNGGYTGHVRIYDWNGTAWVQLGADIDGEAAGDVSGRGGTVSMNATGDKLAIGAQYNGGNGASSGHVRIYGWNGTAWIQLVADIDGEAAGDNSGIVSMNAAGDRVAIGATLNGGNGASSGHVRTYSGCFSSYSTDNITELCSFTWMDGVTYTASNNTATHTLTNVVGCDSIITLDLTITNYATTDSITSCTSSPCMIWIDNQQYCGNNNTATAVLPSLLGCDSVVTLNYTVFNSTTAIDSQAVCGSSYTWIDGVTYTASNNTATYTLTNAAGCDSVVTLDLILDPDDFNLAISATQQVFTAPPFITFFSNNTPNMSDYTFTWHFGDDSTLQTNNSNVFHEYLFNGLYEVKLIAENNITGCTDTLAEQDFIYTSGGPSLSINESKRKINIYPNPTNENITILVNNFNGNIQTELFDLIGNRLHTTNKTTISLRDYSKGIYILKVAYGNRVEEVKVIKE